LLAHRQHNGENDVGVIKRFLKDESGATAIEYGLIAAGISVAIITVLSPSSPF
jgi:pilus assembly protein Flp/PilA